MSVSVSVFWVGGLAGRRTRVRVPLESGRRSEAGGGGGKTEQSGISMRVVISVC